MASQEGPAVGRSGGRQHRQVPPSGRDHGAVDAQLVATAWLAHSHVSTSIPTGAAHSPGEGPITPALSRAREKERRKLYHDDARRLPSRLGLTLRETRL